MRARWILAAAITAGLAACSPGPGHVEQPTTDESGVTQALHGVFRVEYAGDEQVWNGKPNPGQLSARQYAVRSACSRNTCVATGIRLRDDDATRVFQTDDGRDVAPLTLDFVDGQWLWAEQYAYRCEADGSGGRQFVAWSISPQPDGRLTGTRVDARFASPSCSGISEVPITLTRVGDVDATTALPDPATQPAWAPKAPVGLAGDYRLATKPRQPGDQPPTLPAVFTSFCVRNTETCIAVERFTGSSGSEAVNALEFGAGRWALTYLGGEVTCPLGGKAARETYLEFVMPTSAPTPFATVTGLQRFSYRGDCTDVNEWDVTATRVPD